MTTAIERADVDLNGWAPGAKFYIVDDGRYFVVDADLDDYGRLRVVRRPTVILYCTETAGVTDLIPDFEFDPGTTHEDAVRLAGFTLGS
ncbi:hypothetical protein [Mycolicibacterium fortuitum]|uniref:DUF7572 family protein n=1 Tax=Mycolicibacterium fortuitum TaxID=1766 RepID=UPI0007EAB49D|nr:hypothetical protein [Mycolicibacterium fortuitum]OBB48743.1 hypothetical protein A5754_31905 [Mycolicibacterium fortuitum]OBB66449.1 hypothetical protein A5755_02515 [Mycolicibacterium fortuitum]OBF83614.1 hypothetical protein A5751_12715 [Mycolicibacterium fortuitum]